MFFGNYLADCLKYICVQWKYKSKAPTESRLSVVYSDSDFIQNLEQFHTKWTYFFELVCLLKRCSILRLTVGKWVLKVLWMQQCIGFRAECNHLNYYL